MVQRANFAYDDEELSGDFGGAGGCWFVGEEDEEPEEDLFDSPEELEEGLNKATDFLMESDLSEQQVGSHDWKRTSPREEMKPQPRWLTDSPNSRKPK